MKENIENIVIYKSNSKNVSLEVSMFKDTVWLTQSQMIELFGRDQSVISRHLTNIFKEGELNQKSNMQNMHIANSDKPVKFYNLDVVISVGYRVKSLEGTRFRQWAIEVLRKHIVDGYTFNKQVIKKNYEQFSEAVEQVKSVLKSTTIDNDSVIELISMFANTWLSLDAYDKDQLSPIGTSKKKVTLTADKLSKALQELKKNLMSKGEATELFAAERTKESVSGIIGNVMQSFGDNGPSHTAVHAGRRPYGPCIWPKYRGG